MDTATKGGGGGLTKATSLNMIIEKLSIKEFRSLRENRD